MRVVLFEQERRLDCDGARGCAAGGNVDREVVRPSRFASQGSSVESVQGLLSRVSESPSASAPAIACRRARISFQLRAPSASTSSGNVQARSMSAISKRPATSGYRLARRSRDSSCCLRAHWQPTLPPTTGRPRAGGRSPLTCPPREVARGQRGPRSGGSKPGPCEDERLQILGCDGGIDEEPQVRVSFCAAKLRRARSSAWTASPSTCRASSPASRRVTFRAAPLPDRKQFLEFASRSRGGCHVHA